MNGYWKGVKEDIDSAGEVEDRYEAINAWSVVFLTKDGRWLSTQEKISRRDFLKQEDVSLDDIRLIVEFDYTWNDYGDEECRLTIHIASKE